ncbi:MAG: hypothetical protein ABIG46_00720 [Candidatus Omnitrophota bacterium]|nr:hypothetical protein [Candidatus Omnitrophota bacterium]
MFRKRKGQSTLETALVLVITFSLVGGIVNIWIWANRQIVERQVRYNNSRVAAGTSSDDYELQWPVYEPDELTEEEVILR